MEPVANTEVPTPLVSIIVPAYLSGRTIIEALRSLRQQSYPSKEIIVVDSSPTAADVDLIRGAFPDVVARHHGRRLLPHQARNVGAGLARGAILVFTDPDIYTEPDWLQCLVDVGVGDTTVGIGAIGCYGRRWFDTGVHICKYGGWLPGGPPREIAAGHSAALICSRTTFDALGGFDDEVSIGDTDFCWRASERGYGLLFEPRAAAVHDHQARWVPSLIERFRRGLEFGAYRARRMSTGNILLLIGASVIPLRLAKHLAGRARSTARAGVLGDFLATLPVIFALLATQLAGEIAGYASAVWSRRNQVSTTPRMLY
jgi:GT2 family glycosyltransferase